METESTMKKSRAKIGVSVSAHAAAEQSTTTAAAPSA
jgi:hypothetical protein